MKRKKIRGFFKHPFVIAVFSGLIGALVGVCTSAYFSRANIERQSRFDLYKEMMSGQREFVDHLSKDIYTRVYKLSAYFSHLKSLDLDMAKEWRVKYRAAAEEWSGELRFYLTNLDRHFPPEKFKIGQYVIATDLFKGSLDCSFRDILQKDLQPRFVNTHRCINDTQKRINNGLVISKEEMDALDQEIDALYKRVYEFTEALSKASGCYNIPART